MLKSIVMSCALVVLIFVGQAVALAPLSDSYTLGPYTATGVGATEAEARAEALESIEDHLDQIEAQLPKGHSIVGHWLGSGTWDFPIYEIDYVVLIHVDCD